jgi:hypothetical protein
MSTFIAWVAYGAFAVAYVAMLVLTERTAGRYVRGEIRQPHSRATLVVVAKPCPAAPGMVARRRLAPDPA